MRFLSCLGHDCKFGGSPFPKGFERSLSATVAKLRSLAISSDHLDCMIPPMGISGHFFESRNPGNRWLFTVDSPSSHDPEHDIWLPCLSLPPKSCEMWPWRIKFVGMRSCPCVEDKIHQQRFNVCAPSISMIGYCRIGID